MNEHDAQRFLIATFAEHGVTAAGGVLVALLASGDVSRPALVRAVVHVRETLTPEERERAERYLDNLGDLP